MLGFATVSGFLMLVRLHVQNDVLKLLPAQFLAYLYLFLGLGLLFRTQYGRPFWSSLGWTSLGLKPGAIVAYGVLLAFAVGLASRLLHTPEGPTPMSKLLEDRVSISVLAVGASRSGLCARSFFRGFMQRLVRSLGAAGVLAAAIRSTAAFAGMRLPWQPGLLITLAGAALTDAAPHGFNEGTTLMHAAYSIFFSLCWRSRRICH